MSELTRDVTAIANIHPLSGLLSNLGILLWCATASVCFFAMFILHKSRLTGYSSFLFSAAMLTTYLMLDDAFLIHEHFVHNLLNINQIIVPIALGLFMIVFVLVYRQIILKSNYLILVVSLVFLAASVFIDSIPHRWFEWDRWWKFFLEDGTKWIGICFWCSYFVQTSYSFLVKENKLL